MTPLMRLITSLDSNAIDLIITEIQRDPNAVNTKDETGFFPLLLAINDVAITKALLDAGAIVDTADSYGHTPLLMASRFSNACSNNQVVKMLLNAKANPNLHDDTGRTALSLACQYSRESSSVETVKMLIDANADLNHRDNNGQTPLMISSMHCDSESRIETVELLISAGADVNLQDRYGNTALMLACAYSNMHSSDEAVRMLINAKADINAENLEHSTAVNLVCSNIGSCSNRSTLKILLDAKANVNIIDKHGFTPLITVCNNPDIGDDVETVKLLIEAGADPDFRFGTKLTAVMIAARYRKVEQMLYFINIGANYHLKSLTGKTCFHLYIEHNKPTVNVMLKLITKCSTILTETDLNGKTVYDYYIGKKCDILDDYQLELLKGTIRLGTKSAKNYY